MTDSLSALGGGRPCEPNATSSRCSCHICSLQAVYLKHLFISWLPRFLKCHLCLMDMLISCIRKTHSGHYQLHLQSGFMPNSPVGLICHRTIPEQLDPQMMQSTNLLIICNYLYLLTLQVDVFDEAALWVEQGTGSEITSIMLRLPRPLGGLQRQQCAQNCTLPWCNPPVYGQKGRKRGVHDWECDGDNSTLLSSIIYS